MWLLTGRGESGKMLGLEWGMLPHLTSHYA